MKLLRRLADPRFQNLVSELAVCEFKLRAQSTLVGFLWTLLHPLLMFVVIYTLFVKWTGKFVESYPLYLIVGMVQWNYFARGTMNGLSAVLRKQDLVTNFIFPREAVVVAGVCTDLAIHVLEVFAMLIFLLFLGAPLGWNWLFLPCLILLETVIILGVSFILAKLAVDYKDLVRVWDIFTFAGFFLTPIFYPIEIISPEKQKVLYFNPMMHLITETRKFLVFGQNPSLADLAGLTAFALALTWLGFRVFKSGEQTFAEKFT